MTSAIEEKLKNIQDAINYEIDNHYVNSKGKKSTFSDFLIKNTKELSRDITDRNKLKSLINLFYGYATQDLSQRMETIHKAQSILGDIFKENKNRKSSLPEKKERFQIETDIKKIDVKYVKGVGPKLSLVLNRLGIFTVHDLLHYFPREYADYQKQVQIKDIKDGENVTIVGKIKGISYFDPPKKKAITIITITVIDDTGKIVITKFSSRKFSKIMIRELKKQYPTGTPVLCAGTVTYDKFARAFALANPSISPLESEDSTSKNLNALRIVPIYPLTEGLTLDTVRKILANALEMYLPSVHESLPKKILEEEKLLDLKTCIKQIHFPDSNELCSVARQRLIYEEFLILQLHLANVRYEAEKNRKPLSLKETENDLVDKLIKSLPFELTNAQKRVFNEIKYDLMSGKPMHRLLQGDVGSGKTIVAVLALLFAIENGYQTALMAPTEILCNQHAKKIQDYLAPLGIKTALLTGSTPQKLKKQIYEDLRNGEIKLIVGTHALIQKEVEFANLGFVTIDEQHRFGVKQRDDLLKKGEDVERLFMTATPIPRTLALALHGDLELSEIDELPPGRMPIKTSVVPQWKLNKAFDLIKSEIEKGKQAYIVFPLIEESEEISAKAATIEYEQLSTNIFKNYKLGLMHGNLSSKEKDEVMEKFIKGETNILVSTTVIEVGVDVPNATVMLIENAERFGLSQLHQLRGRIGRGGEQGYCLLVPQNNSEDSMRRLQIMTATSNGFIISQEDLKLRGPGDFLGTKQSGLPNMLLADIVRDASILESARDKAIKIIKEDPELNNHSELKATLTEKRESFISAG